MSNLVKVGITHGDSNGVGYEILLKAFSDNRLTELLTPIIYGSSKVASYHRKVLNSKSIPFNMISNCHEAKEGQINFINAATQDVKVEIGIANQTSGEAAYQALEAALADIKNSDIKNASKETFYVLVLMLPMGFLVVVGSNSLTLY